MSLANLKSVMKTDVTAEFVEKSIWSVLPVKEQGASYDPIARVYDWIIGNTLYNRLVWGNWSNRYSDAAIRAVEASRDGPILDCGCGSLIFTRDAYQSVPLERIILFDRSIGMMRRGAKRVPGATFLQGNALALPFADASFGMSLSWGLAHIFGSEADLFSELRRVTQRGGSVRISVLILANRSPGDWVLSKLFARGEIARPERANAVRAAFERYFTVESETLCGNMLFLNGRV